MTTFKYQGYDGAGVKTAGEMQAGSPEEVERRLSMQNITPTVIAARKAGKATESSSESIPRPKGRKGKISDSERAGILRDLATMVDAGVPFVESLDAVAVAKLKPAIAVPLLRIKATIVEGGSISAAMRSATELFPPLVGDVINVAERGGRLDSALDNAAAYLERAADLRRKIANAAMYPLVMLTVSGLMTIVIVIFVLPQFGDLFTKMKADLPITTKAMLAVGKIARTQPLLSVGATVASVVVATFILRLQAVKRLLGRLALRMPMLGDLLIRLGLARSLRVIATLLASNVPIMTALENGSKVAGVPAISRALDDAAETVRTGGTLSDSFRRSSCIPSAVTQMVIVGERTGRLGALLASCAEKMESESDARLKSLVSVIEPVMILFMGILVGGITISVITPIYSSVGNIK